MDKAIFALIGVVVGAVLNHFTAVKREERQRFDIAAVKFRSVVDIELIKWHSPQRRGTKVQNREFDDSLERIIIAANEFYYFIEAQRRDAYLVKLEDLEAFRLNTINRPYDRLYGVVTSPYQRIEELDQRTSELVSFTFIPKKSVRRQFVNSVNKLKSIFK